MQAVESGNVTAAEAAARAYCTAWLAAIKKRRPQK